MSRTASAVLFSGQGTQYPGMGKSLYDASARCRQLFALAGDVFETDMEQLCFHGPQETLNQTEYTQPAVLVVDLCAYLLAREDGIVCRAVAGFSLGEYAALAAAEAVTLQDALCLVKWRTQAMMAAAADKPYGMAAVIGATPDEVAKLCRMVEAGSVFVSNHNSSKQLSVSGDKEGLEAFGRLAARCGSTVIPLKVNRPFHCELMRQAADAFSARLEMIPFQRPRLPLYMNATGSPVEEPDAIRSLLARQIYQPVLWKETLENLYSAGVTSFIECGPKSVSGRLLRDTLGDVPYAYRFYTHEVQAK